MKTRDSPPPVHVHVPETTPVHVHMRRSPSRAPQNRTKDVQLKGEGGRSKGRAPWIPPGRLSCKRDVGSYTTQKSRVQLQSDSGIGFQRDAEEQEDELAAVCKNFTALLKEQESNRRSKRRDAEHREANVLLRALVEAEIDGVAVSNQLTALKETIDGLENDKRLSKLHGASVGRQKELLSEKMQVFDHTNHNLRELLREWRESERESLVWSEQKDALKRRLADSEAENIRLLGELTYSGKEASKLEELLDFEKHNVKTTEEMSRILESTRDQLESQLSRTEAEKGRLAAQIQRMQKSFEQQHVELQVLQEELQTLRPAEESARKLGTKLQEKESQLAQALSTSSDWCLRLSKEASAKQQLEEDISALKFQVSELSSQLHSSEERLRSEREELRDQLHHLSAENASMKLDNQRLKGQVTSSEEKLRGLQAEARQLRSAVKQHEGLVDKYKKKIQQARLKSDEYCLKLEMTQTEVREVNESLDREKEHWKRELLGRHRELETLPDKLRRTEQLLRDTQLEAEAHERRNMEHNSALAEVEQQGAQLETLQRRNLLLQEENNVLKEKNHNTERKLENMKVENQEVSRALTSKETSIRSIEQQLEEKARECSVVSRQLQQSRDDAQQQVDDRMQRALAKERVSESKALDLQSQLSRARTERSQLQRSKEEMERRFQSQLKNMKDKLEQSDSTNRKLQNYVEFLKTSYGNVFGDSLLTS